MASLRHLHLVSVSDDVPAYVDDVGSKRTNPAKRRIAGRFDSFYSDEQLYRAVRDVAVGTELRERLSARKFNERKAEFGHADCPTAQGILTMLRTSDGSSIPWQQIVETQPARSLSDAKVWVCRDAVGCAARVRGDLPVGQKSVAAG